MNFKPRRGAVKASTKNNRSELPKFVLFLTAGVAIIAFLAIFGQGWGVAYGQTVPNPTSTPTATPPTIIESTATATAVPTTKQATATPTTVKPTETTKPTKTPGPPDNKVQLSITKAVSLVGGGAVPNPVAPGTQLVFTIVLTNNGTVASDDDTTITDILASGFDIISATSPDGTPTISGKKVTLNVGSLAPGKSVSLNITVSVSGRGALVNIARADANVGGLVITNNSNSTIVQARVETNNQPTAQPPSLPNTGQSNDSSNGGSTTGLVVILIVLLISGLGVIGMLKRNKRA